MAPGTSNALPGVTVYVGINDVGGGEVAGLPLLDAAFEPENTSTNGVYIVPVLVQASGGGCPYRAAAKLALAFSMLGVFALVRFLA